MRTIKGKYSGLWAVRDVLYFFCPVCNQHLPWKKMFRSTMLTSSCCGYCYQAKPVNEASRFEIFVSDADMSNVVILYVVDTNP